MSLQAWCRHQVTATAVAAGSAVEVVVGFAAFAVAAVEIPKIVVVVEVVVE